MSIGFAENENMVFLNPEQANFRTFLTSET
jgi:hypothetical protein